MLKDLTLQALAETKLQGLFSEALAAVEKSLQGDQDVKGGRTITMSLKFTPTDRGYIAVDFECFCKTPNRKVMTLATLEEGTLKIDTISNDARQGDLLDPGNIVDFKKYQEGGV